MNHPEARDKADISITEAIDKAKAILGSNYRCFQVQTTYNPGLDEDTDYFVFSHNAMQSGLRCASGESLAEMIEDLEESMRVSK